MCEQMSWHTKPHSGSGSSSWQFASSPMRSVPTRYQSNLKSFRSSVFCRFDSGSSLLIPLSVPVMLPSSPAGVRFVSSTPPLASFYSLENVNFIVIPAFGPSRIHFFKVCCSFCLTQASPPAMHSSKESVAVGPDLELQQTHSHLDSRFSAGCTSSACLPRQSRSGCPILTGRCKKKEFLQPRFSAAPCSPEPRDNGLSIPQTNSAPNGCCAALPPPDMRNQSQVGSQLQP